MRFLVVRRTLSMSAAALSVLVLAAGPAGAVASGTTQGGNRVDINSSGSDSIAMSCAGGNAAVNGVVATPALACGSVQIVNVVDLSGSDNVNFGDVTAAVFPGLNRVLIDVDDGAQDTVVGTAFRDEITGNFGIGTGDIVAGGPGNDRIDTSQTADGGDGDDLLMHVAGSIQGGPGNDRIYNPGSGPIDGGPGYDTAELDFTPESLSSPLSIVVSDAGLTLTLPGLSPINYSGASIEAWQLTTTDGAHSDNVDSRGYGGRMVVHTVAGDDVIHGGAAADFSDGGNGNDTIDPGTGGDLVEGGPGNDTIMTRDGVTDTVDCGDGTDTVTADVRDVVVNCETVSILPPDTAAIIGPKKVTRGDKVLYILGTRAQEYAGASFDARIDHGPFKPVSNPFKLKTKKLKLGKHTIEVRAVLPAGNVDPTPSILKIKVVAKR